MRRGAGLLGAWLCFATEAGLAHPLGNNTVNRWAQLEVSVSRIYIDYVLDLAELPTLVESSAADRDGDGAVSAREWDAYAQAWAQRTSRGLRLAIDGESLALMPGRAGAVELPGDAGLSTVRLEVRLRADFPGGMRGKTVRLAYRDETAVSAPGWKEAVLRATQGAQVHESTFYGNDRSRRLSDFGATSAGDYPDMTSGAATVALAAAAEPAGRETAASAPLPGSFDRGRAPDRAVEPADAQAERLGEPMASTQANREAGLLGHYFRLGMHHIAVGLDHVLFLLGLLLLSPRLSQCVKVVTAFTLAHSLTLALAARGLVVASGVLVEAGIAATIVWVGVMGWRRSGGHGVELAFAFGLVHGFGFAGGLADLVGERSAHWLLPLAAFNLGIEAMQVVLIAVAFPLLNAVRRQAWGGALQRAMSASIAALGLAWLVTRSASALGWPAW